jgi:hypothetical protein
MEGQRQKQPHLEAEPTHEALQALAQARAQAPGWAVWAPVWAPVRCASVAREQLSELALVLELELTYALVKVVWHGKRVLVMKPHHWW